MHLVVPIYVLHFIPTILTGIMAWKTSGVDDLYSESKWVLAFMLVQFQVRLLHSVVVCHRCFYHGISSWLACYLHGYRLKVMIVTVPVVLLINDLSSNGRFLCYSLLVWTFPMSTMGLIILPKIVTVRRMKRKAKPNPLPTSDVQSTNSASNESATRNVADATLHQHNRAGPRIQIVTFD